MFEKIVLALDGSEGSKRAVPVAVELAEREGAAIVIAHVDERVAAKGGPASARLDESGLEADLERQAKEIKTEHSIDTRVESSVVVLGGPATGIVEIADRVDADLIVVGTQGRTGVAGLVVGGVTHRLLHIAHCPVLVVPPHV